MIPDYFLSRLPEARELLAKALASYALSPDLVDMISSFLVTGFVSYDVCNEARVDYLGSVISNILWMLLHSSLPRHQREESLEVNISILRRFFSSNERPH